MSFLQPSKYRNSIFTAANKNDWISFSNQSTSNLTDLLPIKASRTTIAIREGTSNVALAPLSSKGRVEPSIISHSSAVSDLDWCLWQDGGPLLAVGGERSGAIYAIDDGLKSNSVCTFGSSRIDRVSFHPTARDLILYTSGNTATIYNYNLQTNFYEWDNGSKIQSFSCDNKLKIFDPRKATSPATVFDSHNGVKESAVQWCGHSDFILSAGFNSRRNREIALWDIRNASTSVTTIMLDNGQGIMNLMYDDDTGMAFIVGRGDSKISWCEFNTSNTKLPLDTQRLPFSFNSAFVGATIIPKLAVNVMEGEVNRILSVTNDNCIVPINIRVPRKSYLDFHADIFPDTLKDCCFQSADEWKTGNKALLLKISLDPKFNAKNEKVEPVATESENLNLESSKPSANTITPDVSKLAVAEVTKVSPSKVDLPKHSSFKYLSVTQKLLLDDLKAGPVGNSNESNGFELFYAFRMSGSGGRIGIYSTQSTGRFPTKIPSIINGVELGDFKFDPFSPEVLVTGCEDGKVREFRIPAKGLEEDISETKKIYSAHGGRVSLLLFHPRIKNLLLTSSPENGIPTILSVAFKNDGHLFATVTKNSEIGIYDLHSGELKSKGPGHKGSKAARLMWLDSKLISVGFSSGSQREILVYNDKDVSNTIGSVIIDSSPSFLIPYLDEDTNVLMLSAKGEGVLIFYEIDGATPVYLNKVNLPLGNTVAIANMPKSGIDVAIVEIFKAYRLTQTSITQLSFTVPRLRKEYFQDDIFPPTLDYSASISVAEWLQGKLVPDKKINLCPSGMVPLSKAPVEATHKAPIPTFTEVRSEEDQKQASIKAMFEMAKQETKGPLVQDLLEGGTSVHPFLYKYSEKPSLPKTMKRVTLYYDVVSPFSWFGFLAIVKYSKIWNIELVLKPVFLGGIMKGSNNTPPANNPIKGTYMNLDLDRNYRLYGIEKLKFPNEFPANSLPAMRILTVIKKHHKDQLVPASLALWKQYWANGKVFSLENMVESLSPIFGGKTRSIFEESTTDLTKQELQSATKEALDSGSFGAPWFVVENGSEKHNFFGSDRFEAMAHFLDEPYHGFNPDKPLGSKL
ncbi:Coronin-7 [Terramyces sp. JEL0728]|nr:Coronin-7 [Terramyces sp. JEL0728]